MLHLAMLLLVVQGRAEVDTSAIVAALGVAARSAVDSARIHQLRPSVADSDIRVDLRSFRQASGAANLELGSLARVVQVFGAKGIGDSLSDAAACTVPTRCTVTANVIQVSMNRLVVSADSITSDIAVHYADTRSSGRAAMGFVQYRVVMPRRGAGYTLGSVTLIARS